MKPFGRWLASRATLLATHKVNTWSGLVLIAWAKVIFWNSTPLTTVASYRITTDIFNEDHWEMIAFTVGCVQLIGVISGSKWIRFVASSLAAWIFFTLGYSLISASAIAPGSTLHFGWGFINLHSMMFAIKRRQKD